MKMFKQYIKAELFDGSKFNLFKLAKTNFLNINLRFVYLLRFRMWAIQNKVPFLSGYIHRRLAFKYGCYIASGVKIGIGVKFPHPNGIVIGGSTKIGENCTIYQQVTFGGKVIGDAQKGNYPIVGDNVIIFSGAKIIGNVEIGNNAIIGANSVVNKDVPEFSVVGGIPAKVLKTISK